MMCEHELINLTGNFGKQGAMTARACHKCMKTTGEIDLEQQLAAAKAELAAEREKREIGPVMYWRQKAEQAEMKFIERERLYVSTITKLVDDKADLKRHAEQVEAQCAAMRLRFEQYVRNNCTMIERLKSTVGIPDLEDGKCQGYTVSSYDDEPADRCKGCVAALREDEEPDAGTFLLTRLHRMEGALWDCIQQLELLHPKMNPEEPCTVYEAWMEAKAALEEKP